MGENGSRVGAVAARRGLPFVSERERIRGSAGADSALAPRFARGLLALLNAGAFAIVMVAAGPVRADGCNFNDVVNAIENTLSSLSSGACGAACAEGGAGCIVAAGAAAALGGDAASQGQGSVDNLCNQLNTGLGDVDAIKSWLDAAGVGADLISDVSSLGLGPLLSIAQCGCDLEQGVGQLSNEAGSCLADAICGLQQDLGFGGCGCTPPTPVAEDCSAIVFDNNNPPDAQLNATSNGTLVTDLRTGWDGHSQYCSPQHYCFCPSPMQLSAPQPDIQALGSDPWPCIGQSEYYCAWYYTCQCPQGTHAAAKSGPLTQVCLCDNTGLAAVAPVKTTTNPTASICPIPFTGIPCPNGQVNVGGKCVTPCTNNEVRTPNGACCSPAEVTACGSCCPPGTQADLANGTCYPVQTTQ